ncbi:hypothetical protein AVEN_211010-1 [Araneus ventricosus]|uniref:Uncharacterized protein n=1 Tax=Araneus ventricosus TaxID=182803 RepID=A0A4Y2V4Q8_ARAVE|nr:hypothetical protein AVEN_211010-1 [Araneus ventricosus]
MIPATHWVKKRPFVVLSSDFRNSNSQTNTTEVELLPYHFPSLSLFSSPPSFETSYLQNTGEWLLSCLLVISPQAGQITQLQSYAFLHGVDWLWSNIDEGLVGLNAGGLATEG